MRVAQRQCLTQSGLPLHRAFLTPDQRHDSGEGGLHLDSMTRKFIHDHLGGRLLVYPNDAQAIVLGREHGTPGVRTESGCGRSSGRSAQTWLTWAHGNHKPTEWTPAGNRQDSDCGDTSHRGELVGEERPAARSLIHRLVLGTGSPTARRR